VKGKKKRKGLTRNSRLFGVGEGRKEELSTRRRFCRHSAEKKCRFTFKVEEGGEGKPLSPSIKTCSTPLLEKTKKVEKNQEWEKSMAFITEKREGKKEEGRNSLFLARGKSSAIALISIANSTRARETGEGKKGADSRRFVQKGGKKKEREKKKKRMILH